MMARCPSCGARRDASDDYCPVCGETLTDVHFSEATGPPWYERTNLLLVLVLLFWPAALYAVHKRDGATSTTDTAVLAGSLVMAVVWLLIV